MLPIFVRKVGGEERIKRNAVNTALDDEVGTQYTARYSTYDTIHMHIDVLYILNTEMCTINSGHRSSKNLTFKLDLFS